MKHYIKSGISIVLTLAIISQAMVLTAFAQEESSVKSVIENYFSDIADTDDNLAIVCEDISLRDEYTKVYILEDGSYYSVTSSVPIHEYVNGRWEDLTDLGTTSIGSIDEADNFAENLLIDTNRTIRSATESTRMEINNNVTNMNTRFINNSNTGEIYKYQSFWVKPAGLTDTFDSFQSVTVSAVISLNCQVPSTGTKISAYEVLSDWNNAIDYNLKSSSFNSAEPGDNILHVKNKTLDIENVQSTGVYDWDITDLYYKWEHGISENNGVVFTSRNTGNHIIIGGYTFSRRFRIIDESDSNFNYRTIDMGRAGEISFNEFTDTIKITRAEPGVFDEQLPVNITRVIDLGKTYTMTNPAGIGSRWNYESKMGTLNSLSYYWKTINGVTIYFTRSTENEIENGRQKWVSSSNDYTLWMDATATVNGDFSLNTVIDQDGNWYEFDALGRLVKIVDSHSTASQLIEINIVYSNSVISKIIDSSGRCFKFNYGTLDRIQYVSNISIYNSSAAADNGTSSELVCINNVPQVYSYQYSSVSGMHFIALTGVTYPDGNSVSYTYDNINRLTKVTDIDGSVLEITYADNSSKRISQLLKKSGSSMDAVNLEKIEVDSHNTYQRTITTSETDIEIIGFNHHLDMTYRRDNNGNKYYISYDEYNEPKQIVIGENSTNLLINPGFESDDEDAWCSFGGIYEFKDGIVSDSDISLKVISNQDQIYGMCQTVEINGHVGDIFAIGGYGYADNIIPLDYRSFGLMVFKCDESGDINIYDSTPLCVVNFDNTITRETQYNLGAFVLEEDIDYIAFCLVSAYQTSDVFFDDISFYAVNDSNYIPLQEETEIDGCNCSTSCNYGAGCPCQCSSVESCSCVCCNSYESDITNSEGVVTSHIVSDGNSKLVNNYSYNSGNNYLTSVTDENGITRYYTYNSSNGLLTSTSLSNAQNYAGAINYTYNAVGLLNSVSQAITNAYAEENYSVNMSVQYGYTYDTVTSITHNGFTYSFDYDTYGNCTAVNVNNNTVAEYEYSSNYDKSTLNCVNFANGDSTIYTYADDKITSIRYDNGNGNTSDDQIFTYNYNTDGELISVHDSFSGNTISFNSLGYIIYNSGNTVVYSLQKNNDGTVTEIYQGRTYTYEHNSDYDYTTGHTEASIIQSMSGNRFESSADSDFYGRLTENNVDVYSVVGEGESTASTALVSVSQLFGYNDRTTGNDSLAGTQLTTYDYSLDFSNTNYPDTSFRREYGYDDNGNLTEIYNTITSTPTLLAEYEYDEAGQIIRENNRSLNKTYIYVYDAGGNISQRAEYAYSNDTLPSTPTDVVYYTYDTVWKDKLVSYDGTTITYDEIGNPLSYGTDESFEWQGKLLKSYTKGDKKYKYYYDSDGYRIKKETYNLTTTEGIITETLDQSREYIWQDGKLVGETSFSGTSVIESMKYLYDAAGLPYALIFENGAICYYVRNQFGDVEKIVRQDGQAIVYYEYDAWGNATFNVNTDSWGLAIDGLVVMANNSITYRGYCYDIDTGLYYLKSRYYNAQWGRFLNCDNIENIQNDLIETNLYSYCCNNPILYFDFEGDVASELAIGGATISIGMVVAVALAMAYLVDPNIRNAVNNTVILLAVTAPNAIINAVKRIAQSVSDARKAPKTPKVQTHHIVAQNDSRASVSRSYLKKVGISISSKVNLVSLNQRFHSRLHTNEYYIAVEKLVVTGYNKAQKVGVYAALLLMNALLKTVNSIFF